MELDYSEIHRSRKIRGTEQSESIEDKRFGEILTKGLHRMETEIGKHHYPSNLMACHYPIIKGTVWEGFYRLKEGF